MALALPPEGQSLLTSAPTIHAACRAVSQRAAQTLKWVTQHQTSLLDIALDHLTLGRAALYAAMLESCGSRREEAQTSAAESQSLLTSAPTIATARHELDAAVSGLRRAGEQRFVPLGLLTRAWLRFLTGPRTGPASAQADLDEAWEIAARGPMRLFLADIHLHRARLFGARQGTGDGKQGAGDSAPPYPWPTPPDGSPRGPAADLSAAEQLIKQCGYHRRDEELADAQRALGVS